MNLINPGQWPPLFDAVYEMNTAKDHADFLSAVAMGMARLIPADLCVVHMLHRETQRMVVQTVPENPYLPEEMAWYAAHPGEDPLVGHFERTGDSMARRTSDVMPLREYLQTSHFIHCQKRLGFIHTLALPVKINADTVGALSFDRCGANFTKRHCALLDAFAPHFVLAWERHQDPWAAAHQPVETVRGRLQKLGLTVREADVLFWMTEGKQNREIATILGRSLGTVQEHVANILVKLGQENRHAATVHAMRSLGMS
jgi:DNA-binding CsgD family transcriptional regulator